MARKHSHHHDHGEEPELIKHEQCEHEHQIGDEEHKHINEEQNKKTEEKGQ